MSRLDEQVYDQQERKDREGGFQIALEKLPGAEGNDGEDKNDHEDDGQLVHADDSTPKSGVDVQLIHIGYEKRPAKKPAVFRKV